TDRYLRGVVRARSAWLAAFAAWFTAPSYGQGDIRDTSILIVPISLSYAYQLPNGDLSERFGANSNVGLSVSVKFRNNYLVGLEGGFLFGDKVLEPGLLSNVATSNGAILDINGLPANVLLYERGYTVMAYAGRVVPIVGPNPNSGLLLKVGGGYMRHKIRVQTQDNVVPQLEGDYLAGYDRLAAGPAAMLFVGYQHLSSNRLTNFFVGFEMLVGLTEPLRAYNFDTGRAEDGPRYDGLNGLRIGWTLPLYRRSGEGFYMY
ncbi:MAG: hypothetical protein KDC02_01280, partial [Flavobacteriales bacterium]|nr:hypothetical protein [Flavobacteriales bacterium]